MTTTAPWSDTPPSPDKPGDYHLLARNYSGEIVATYNPSFVKPWASGKWAFNATDEWVAAAYQFGPRVLSAEDAVALTAEVERLRAAAAELAEIHKVWRIGGRSS